MPKFVALLRGIAPAFPNMKNEDLRGVFETLGFTGISTVLSSGNILFESEQPQIARWERILESAWPAQLGFKSTTTIRSQKQLRHLLAAKLFNEVTHSASMYLMVTFFKRRPKLKFKLPYRPSGKPYEFVHYSDQALCSITDSTAPASDPGGWLEHYYGKEMTSRSAQTVKRILQKMEEG
jgi:uncharacterized protein (DUF1697 family)